VVAHQTVDPELIVAEFTLHGTVEDQGDAHRMSYVNVYRVRDGRFLSLRDYWDPLALAAPARPAGAARAPGGPSRAGA
jgi:ketosteroid isomerase-like protein